MSNCIHHIICPLLLCHPAWWYWKIIPGFILPGGRVPCGCHHLALPVILSDVMLQLELAHLTGQPSGWTSATLCLTPLYFLVIPPACFTPTSLFRASPSKFLHALFHGETISVYKTNWLLQDQGLHLSSSQECFIQDACGRSHIKFLVLLSSAITSHPHKYGEELLKAGAASALHSYLIVHSSFQTQTIWSGHH